MSADGYDFAVAGCGGNLPVRKRLRRAALGASKYPRWPGSAALSPRECHCLVLLRPSRARHPNSVKRRDLCSEEFSSLQHPNSSRPRSFLLGDLSAFSTHFTPWGDLKTGVLDSVQIPIGRHITTELFRDPVTSKKSMPSP